MKSDFLLLLSLLSLLLRAAKSDLAADRSALLALRNAVEGRSLFWNLSSPTPCSFTGVVCDSGRVTELHLPGTGLSGQLPDNTLGNLTSLTTLSLRYNALTGSVPDDLSKLTGLRNLYLQSNLFTGPVPESVLSLSNLVRLNLASNKFSGEISPKFNSLTRLGTLFLENNNLTGTIPVLNQPSLVQLNVSNNRLSGQIPKELEKKPSSSFSGNLGLCGKPLAVCNGNGNGTTSHEKKDKLSSGAIAGIIIGSVLGFFLILALLICCCMKFGSKKRKDKTVPKEVSAVSQAGIDIPAEKQEGAGPVGPTGPAAVVKKTETAGLGGEKSLVFFGKKSDRTFDLEDLLRASAEVLGKGTFGTAYKAALEGGTIVAVKRLKEVTVPEKEFREKIEVVGKMDHENLVPLRAYYFSRDEKLMVYDYMPMGSLSALLHGNRGATRTPLNWETRSSIALGAANGIAYLHSQGPTVSHGNVKSSNILLTKSYEARVSDFGLSQLAGPTPTPNRVEGYRAPEVTDPRKVSQKADIYSFGVLVLELLTGKAPTQASSNEDGVDLPRWVQSVVREDWNNEVFDPELLRYQSVDEEMVLLLQLAIDCVAQYPDNRPSMSDVSRRIQEICRSSVGKGHATVDDSIQNVDESDKPSIA